MKKIGLVGILGIVIAVLGGLGFINMLTIKYNASFLGLDKTVGVLMITSLATIVTGVAIFLIGKKLAG
jgi:hypothetical protein